MIYSHPPSCGVVLGTYGSVPYIHLQLEILRRQYPDMPILVHDDCSSKQRPLQLLCSKYRADFQSTDQQRGHRAGDIMAYAAGLVWAHAKGLDVLVKISRRWVFLCEWLTDLQRLAMESQASTFSSYCDRWGFGFRTECAALHVPGWIEAKTVDYLRSYSGQLPEFFVDHVAATVQTCGHFKEWIDKQPPYKDAHRNYALWQLLRTRKDEKSPWLLWHETNSPEEFAAEAVKVGVSYPDHEWKNLSQSILPGNTIRGAIRNFIMENAHRLIGPTLEIGSRQTEPGAWWQNNREFGQGEWTGMDSLPGDNVDVVGDVTSLPFKDGTFLSVLCSEVLEHVWQPWTALKEIHRVLASGSWAVVTTLFAFPVHGHPEDYWRMTPRCLERLMTEAGFVDVEIKQAGPITFALNNHGERVQNFKEQMQVFAVGRKE